MLQTLPKSARGQPVVRRTSAAEQRQVRARALRHRTRGAKGAPRRAVRPRSRGWPPDIERHPVRHDASVGMVFRPEDRWICIAHAGRRSALPRRGPQRTRVDGLDLERYSKSTPTADDRTVPAGGGAPGRQPSQRQPPLSEHLVSAYRQHFGHIGWRAARHRK